MHDAPRDIHFKQNRQATYRNTCNWAYFKKHWLCQELEDLTLSDRKQMKTNHLRIIMKLGKNKSPLLIILIFISVHFICSFYLFISLSALWSFCIALRLVSAEEAPYGDHLGPHGRHQLEANPPSPEEDGAAVLHACNVSFYVETCRNM